MKNPLCFLSDFIAVLKLAVVLVKRLPKCYMSLRYLKFIWVCFVAELLERYYVERGLFFEIYDDGTVIMFVFGSEVERRKLRGRVSHTRIHMEFGTELAMYGVGIDPRMELSKLREEVKGLHKELAKLKKK